MFQEGELTIDGSGGDSLLGPLLTLCGRWWRLQALHPDLVQLGRGDLIERAALEPRGNDSGLPTPRRRASSSAARGCRACDHATARVREVSRSPRRRCSCKKRSVDRSLPLRPARVHGIGEAEVRELSVVSGSAQRRRRPTMVLGAGALCLRKMADEAGLVEEGVLVARVQGQPQRRATSSRIA
jgi:hypothetical protein